MICEDMQEELVAYCDGELPEEDRAEYVASVSSATVRRDLKGLIDRAKGGDALGKKTWKNAAFKKPKG